MYIGKKMFSKNKKWRSKNLKRVKAFNAKLRKMTCKWFITKKGIKLIMPNDKTGGLYSLKHKKAVISRKYIVYKKPKVVYKDDKILGKWWWYPNGKKDPKLLKAQFAITLTKGGKCRVSIPKKQFHKAFLKNVLFVKKLAQNNKAWAKYPCSFVMIGDNSIKLRFSTKGSFGKIYKAKGFKAVMSRKMAPK